MRRLVDDWPVETEIVGPWNANVLYISWDVACKVPVLAEWVGGSLLVLVAKEREACNRRPPRPPQT